MARQRRTMGQTTLMVDLARQMIRQGTHPEVVQGRIEDQFDEPNENRVRQIVERAGRGLSNLETVGGIKPTAVVDLPTAMGYSGECGAVRAGITLTFRDEEKEMNKVFKVNVSVRRGGQLRSILNEAVNAAITEAVTKDYGVPFIKYQPGEMSGEGYSIDYLECQR